MNQKLLRVAEKILELKRRKRKLSKREKKEAKMKKMNMKKMKNRTMEVGSQMPLQICLEEMVRHHRTMSKVGEKLPRIRKRKRRKIWMKSNMKILERSQATLLGLET